MDGSNTKDSQILKDSQNFKDSQDPNDRAKLKFLRISKINSQSSRDSQNPIS